MSISTKWRTKYAYFNCREAGPLLELRNRRNPFNREAPYNDPCFQLINQIRQDALDAEQATDTARSGPGMF